MDIGGLRALHDSQLRGRMPKWHPVGVVAEADGPVVRRHYGTHGTADHAPLPAGTDIVALVRRQQQAFGARGEPLEWKVYGHDAPGLAAALTAAGFTPGWERSVLISAPGRATGPEPDAATPPHSGLHDLFHIRGQAERVWELAAGAPGPHRRPYAEMVADGASMDGDVVTDVLLESGHAVAVAWLEFDEFRPFAMVGGLTCCDTEFVRACVDRWRRRWPHRHLLAEADGDLRIQFLAAGFAEVATVRSFHWHPPGTPEASRPAQFLDPLHEDFPLWDRFYATFDFKPSTTYRPGITEPAPSATWHVHAHHRPFPDIPQRLDAIVQRGLLAATEPGEFVYWLEWQSDGFRYDPRRTGLPGRPPRPGLGTYPHGDYYLHLTDDLRLGTFGHPWEQTLCVFGQPLLRTVEVELTVLLGEPLRRRD